jgi:hypothetical protein
MMKINQEALRLLYRELGVVNAVRFLRQFTTGFGDYTQERDLLFEDLTLDALWETLEEEERENPTSL